MRLLDLLLCSICHPFTDPVVLKIVSMLSVNLASVVISRSTIVSTTPLKAISPLVHTVTKNSSLKTSCQVIYTTR